MGPGRVSCRGRAGFKPAPTAIKSGRDGLSVHVANDVERPVRWHGARTPWVPSLLPRGDDVDKAFAWCLGWLLELRHLGDGCWLQVWAVGPQTTARLIKDELERRASDRDSDPLAWEQCISRLELMRMEGAGADLTIGGLGTNLTSGEEVSFEDGAIMEVQKQ